MVKLKTKLGPKGQVVIPQMLRKSYGLVPGGDVIMEDSERGILIERPAEDPIKRMRQIAAMGRQLEKIEPDKDWEEELGDRWKRLLKSI